MKFKKIPISSLLPNPKNPRKSLTSGDPEYQKIKNSVEQFGFADPIIADTETREIIGGHQRLTILHDQGVTHLYELPLGGITWYFPSLDLPKLDKSQRLGLNIALNKIAGEWDSQKLLEAFENLKMENFDISLTGWDDIEIIQMQIPASEKEIVKFEADKIRKITCPHCGKEFPL